MKGGGGAGGGVDGLVTSAGGGVDGLVHFSRWWCGWIGPLQ